MPLTAHELSLDYYTFHETTNEHVGEKVFLRCQFDAQGEGVAVTDRQRFANRATKNGEPVFDDDANLTWYDVVDPWIDPMRKVEYEDQFGESEILLGRLVALLVPTQNCSGGHSPPDELDHFKVFEIVRANGPLGVKADFDGEFGATTTLLRERRYFGVPCVKRHAGREFEIHNEKAHLVLYRIDPDPAEPQLVRTRDQFGRHQFDLATAHLVGAPCLKLGWQEI